MTIGAFGSGDVATIEYLLPDLWMINPTSVRPTIEGTPFKERAPSTDATVVEVLVVDVPSTDESSPVEPSPSGIGCGALTTATNEDVPGKMC